MKNVAVLGGAFDPVHKDHMRVARTCLDRGFCDEVWFMPSPDRWDKQLNASPEDRFAEIEQGDYRGSYVFLMSLKEKFPDINFRLLTGADTYEGIPHWRDPLNFYGTNYNGHLLLRDIELIVFARNGYPQPDMEQHKRNGYAPLYWLGPEQGFNGVYSSTAIRRSLLLNRSVCPQGLEPSVYDYIIKHDLYRV